MDEKLKDTLDKIVLLCKQNVEFDKELKKRLKISTPSKIATSYSEIGEDVRSIRNALEIRANCSISYDFLNSDKYQRLKDQLVIDNLRMENAALNLQIKEEKERFYVFCVNAFYQIENIVNFYFHNLYPDVEDLLCVIEKSTFQDGKFAFCRQANKKYETVGDIEITHKLNAICNILFPNDKVKITYSQLRQVRNEGAHRCMVIVDEHDDNNPLYRFFKNNTFNSIRIYLKKLVSAIEDDLAKQNKITEFFGSIVNVLPSLCYIKVENEIMQVPKNKLEHVHNMQVGAKIVILLRNNQVIDIKNV